MAELNGPPRTANELLFDALVRHQIYLLRLAGGTRDRVIALLDRTDADLRDKILAAAGGVGEGRSPRAQARLQTLLGAVRRLRLRAWDEVTREWVASLEELAEAEPAFLASVMKEVSPVVVDFVLPAAAQLKAIVRSRPFQGRVMREWAKSIAEADIRRIHDQIKIGMVQGDTPRQMARRIVGTARTRGADGVVQITRRQAASITRTAFIHISNQARREFMDLNSDVIQEEVYAATLDARTTPICRSLDGERFPVGEGPIPPLHWGCRSLRVASLDGEVLGRRPAKPVTERGLLREFGAAEGIQAPTRRAALPFGYKGRYDQFARTRTRELFGRVPAATSYQEWLTDQTREFQDDVLGATRGRLFRRGGLDLDKFVDRATYREYTLAELKRDHAAAFRAAGLDPASF